MMGKILPILLILIGLGAGIGGGLAVRPMAPETQVPADLVEGGEEHSPREETPEEEGLESEIAYVKINNQFVVPVINSDKVNALVVLSISLETKASTTEDIYSREPKLRDAFLQVLFDHAYLGGFDGLYTASPTMRKLREALLDSARGIIGDDISDVLITDIVRQDL